MYWWSCPECIARGVEESKSDAEFRLFVHLFRKTGRRSRTVWNVIRGGSHIEETTPVVE